MLTWEASNTPSQGEGQWNQRWLIAKVPSTNEYQIINSHYGVLAGGFAGDRFGSWLVKAGPISTDGDAARWIAEQLEDG